MNKMLTTSLLIYLCNLNFAQDDEQVRIKRLIEDLGSNSLEIRQKAEDELISFGEKAKRLVEEASKNQAILR